MTTLLLARHASHDVVGSVLCGRMPGVHLGAAGRAEAAALARHVAAARPAALFASPQPRARETAAVIGAACGIEPAEEAALDEIDFGAWTGRAFAELDRDPHWRVWNADRATARPPGGEAMFEVQARILAWVETLPRRHPGVTVAAVSHADVIKAALMAHLGLSPDAHGRFEVAPASLSAIVLWPGGGRVRSINETPAPAQE
ncbi:histidine phosphatase family protein [Falsiroseomonas sp. CW058]|uniref:histidine phosphatase family protein n=1 Tax=Falsiroseomonas sp. CW058 TaxID=3388664 RepID=UPI003D31EDC9